MKISSLSAKGVSGSTSVKTAKSLIGAVEVSVEVFDAEKAAQYRHDYAFERQRAIDPKWVEHLASQMKEDLFPQGTAINLAVLPDGLMQLVNGNHRLEAVISSGTIIEFSVIRNHVASLSEAALLYANHDNNKTRSMRVRLDATGALDGIRNENHFISAVNSIQGDFGVRVSSNEQKDLHLKKILIELYVRPYLKILDVIAGGNSRITRNIMRANIMSVAIETMRTQPKKAAEFWSGVAEDDSLARGDPRKTLINYMLGNNSRSAMARRRPEVPQREESIVAAVCWNAFFEGRMISKATPNQIVQFRILGTSWHRGKPDA